MMNPLCALFHTTFQDTVKLWGPLIRWQMTAGRCTRAQRFLRGQKLEICLETLIGFGKVPANSPEYVVTCRLPHVLSGAEVLRLKL